MKDIKTIPQVRLWDAMSKYPPDYEEMEAAVRDGADINFRTGDETGDTLLADLYYCYLEDRCFPGTFEGRENWKKVSEEKRIDGSHLPKITKFFLDRGFDVNRDNGEYGAYALNELAYSSYDTYALLTAKMLIDAGADVNHKIDGFNTVREEIYDWLSYNDENAHQGESDWDKANFLEKYGRLCDVYADKVFETYRRTKKLGFEIVACGGGWEDYKFSYDDGEVTLYSSTVSASYDLNELMEALCFMSPTFRRLIMGESENYTYIDRCEYSIRIFKEKGKDPQWEPIYDYQDDGCDGGDIEYCTDVPLSIELMFDGERDTDWIYLYRQEASGDDFDIFVRFCTRHGDEGYKYYEFLTSYRDLCKAIADGCTKNMKEQGFFGHRASTYGHTISMCKLLFLKAVGNHKEDWLNNGTHGYHEIHKSDYAKEMKLLEM